MIVCPGCGASLPSLSLPPASKLNASGECQSVYYELTIRTLQAGDAAFRHQHAVDAYAAQHVDSSAPRIGPFFALAGLYLALERGYTGGEVQLAHMKMAAGDKNWPEFPPPKMRGARTVVEVAASEDLAEALDEWMSGVWSEWAEQQAAVRASVDRILRL